MRTKLVSLMHEDWSNILKVSHFIHEKQQVKGILLALEISYNIRMVVRNNSDVIMNWKP